MGWTKQGVVRIQKLTSKQLDQIPIFAEKWNRIARCTDSFGDNGDATVEAGIKRFYNAMGCRQPKRGFWYCGGPISACEGSGYKWDDHQKKNPNFYSLIKSAWSIHCFLTRSFEPSIINQVEQFMFRNVARSLPGSSVRRHTDGLPSDIRHTWYGQEDAPWLAMADYFATVHENEHCRRFEGLIRAVESCGFVWLTPDKVFYSDRPESVKFDDMGRLHCEDGPAIEDRDGWEWFFLNGVAVNNKYVKTPPDQINLDEVLKERNSDVRMAVLRKVGFHRLLSKMPNRVISRSGDNELIQFKVGETYPPFFRVLRLKWTDKTGPKETILPVPRNIRDFGADRPDNINDCEQVRRWTLGWPKEALAVAET